MPPNRGAKNNNDSTNELAELRELGGEAPSPETILVAGAISPSNPVTLLSGASGDYTVTLAPPTTPGQIKLIEYVEGDGVVTLNAANIDDSGEYVPTLDTTFSIVGQSIVLVGGSTKWLLQSQFHIA